MDTRCKNAQDRLFVAFCYVRAARCTAHARCNPLRTTQPPAETEDVCKLGKELYYCL